MKLENIRFLDGDFCFKCGSVEFENTITNVSEAKCDNWEYTLVPGFVDIHTHGCGGFDTCDNNLEGYKVMGNVYAKNGVTSFLLTTMTTPKEKIKETLAVCAKYINSKQDGAYPQGIYLEGPFISEKKKGAQSSTNILPPNFEIFEEFWQASNGNIKVAVCAPEVDGGLEFGKKASKLCKISIAHTNANFGEATLALENGFSSATHLYNAMPPLSHREPGTIGAVLDSDCYAEIICDGVHVHPAVVKTTFKAKGEDRMMLISDSTQAAGMPDGDYVLGGQVVTHKNGIVTLADGTIAGSATSMIACVKNCIAWGIPEEVVFKASSKNPATFIGEYDKIGSIEVGKVADLVLLDKDYNIVKTFVKGKEF